MLMTVTAASVMMRVIVECINNERCVFQIIVLKNLIKGQEPGLL